MVTAYEVAAGTPDPELPMLTIADLGILRGVDSSADGVTVTITPTYSGCPAMREISVDIARRLAAAGYDEVSIRTRLAPPWTSDWITAEGHRKLTSAGIAPPGGAVSLTLSVACPRCGSLDTRQTARFGATACRSLYRCAACDEPFEAVKPL